MPALENLNITLADNEFVSIIGPSGSGKSTLMRILAGIIRPDSGELIFAPGVEESRAIVFQNANLLPWFNTLENIALPLMIGGMSKKEALKEAEYWLELVGLKGFAKEWPANLSGGMAQRVALARALIQKPRLLLLDEPLGALDAITREMLALELMGFREQIHAAMLMVTHSISEALILSDRVLVYSERPGRIVNELAVPFPYPRDGSLQDDPEFYRLNNHLRSQIMRR